MQLNAIKLNLIVSFLFIYFILLFAGYESSGGIGIRNIHYWIIDYDWYVLRQQTARLCFRIITVYGIGNGYTKNGYYRCR